MEKDRHRSCCDSLSTSYFTLLTLQSHIFIIKKPNHTKFKKKTPNNRKHVQQENKLVV